MLLRCGWLSGRRYCNLPATGIGGPLASIGPQQRLKRSLRHDGERGGWSTDSTRPCSRVNKRSFHFLSLSSELADIKILAPKICLSRARFDYKNRGAGLAVQLCLHLRGRPSAADLPQPIVNEFLLLSRPVKRFHHTHREQNAAVNPRCYRIIVRPVLRAGLALKDKAIPCAVSLRCQELLILPEELALYHVFVREVCSHEWVVPTFEWQNASGLLAGKYRLDGHVPTHAHMQKQDRLL